MNCEFPARTQKKKGRVFIVESFFVWLSPRTPVYRVLLDKTNFSKYSKVIHDHIIKRLLTEIVHT